MSRFPYQFFNEYVVRTPSFSCKNFQQAISSKDEITDVELKEIFTNPVFQEAIYLASPNLHDELVKWINSEKEFSQKEYQKLKQTLLKYYSRISTRCTPFGLFSFVHLGNFDNEKAIDDNLNNIRDTKLDMHFLVSLAKSFEKIPKLKNQLRFFPNNSIYQIRDNIRYVEYEYNSGKRNYFISSAPFSNELQRVLEFSKEGKTIPQIVKILINEEITENEAIEFVDELIENQVLVSEIEPNVSGKDFLDTLIAVLNRINAKGETEILFSIKTKLNKIDQQLGNSVLLYSEIEDLIKSFEINYEKKFLFQTDLYSGDFFTLSPNWKKKLKEGISFLNKISLLQKDTQFEKFKKAFNERFETQEMPLAYVLDAEVGIGYKQNVQAKGVHHYLEDVKLPVSAKNQALTIEFSKVHVVLNEKLQMALQKNKTIIELLDDDFKDFEEKWNDLPDTISFMAEIISENNQEKLFINGSTGSSAASLLGRFCSEKSEVQNLTKIITSKEEELNQDYILGEIIHLPDARIGNVIRRPTLRNYEIPYLAQSVLPKENQISIDDLFISLENDKIVLRSKKLNRKIKPYLTNAHNYFSATLPVYHFLADFHSQNVRSGLSFDWGGLEHIYQFLPRVEYNNIILSKAQWKITHKDLDFLEQLILDKKQLLSKLKDWRNERNIPAWIQWVKSDNKLTINLENLDTVKMFIDSVKSEKSIIIEEFLYNENDDFKREFIFPMYKLK